MVDLGFTTLKKIKEELNECHDSCTMLITYSMTFLEIMLREGEGVEGL